MAHLTDQDIEQLSAYLDGELKPSEVTAVEARLKAEPELRQMLAELRWMTASLRRLPTRRAPHRYTLSPDMVGQGAGRWTMPAMRFATAALALALVTVIGLDFLGSARRLSMASAPQAIEAPAAAQDNIQSEEAATEKSEGDTQPSFAAQAGAAEGTPAANALRAAEPTLGADASSAETTPPAAAALPESRGSVSSPSLTPTPLPQEPLENLSRPSAAAPEGAGNAALRWSEILLGAGLILLLAIQIRNRP